MHTSLTDTSVLDELITVLPLGIVRIGTDGRVRAANAQACSASGGDPSTLVGLPVVGGLLSQACRLAYEEALDEIEEESRLRPGRTVVSLPRELLLRHEPDEPVRIDARLARLAGLPEDLVLLTHLSKDRRRDHSTGSGPGAVDPLTGLPTRAMIADLLRVALGRLKRHRGYVGLLFLDLDRMKAINDRFGHPAGDLFLCDIAARLRATIRDGDVVARFGGDEFVVLVSDADSESEVDHIAERLRGVITQPLLVGGSPIDVGASIGVAITDDPSCFPEDLIREADAAMYRSKILGGGLTVRFDDELRRSADDRIRLESDLRQAVTSDEILTYFQPIVRLDGAIAGAEALVRWLHPERGLVSPSEFLPLAEETGLIHDIWRIVFEAACRAVRVWREIPGHSDMYVTVNLSARQFVLHGLVDELVEVLRRVDVDPSAVRVEVTESVLVDDPVLAHGVLTDLASRGIKIALDDFGTGYSSLSHLQRFPVDMVKIDRSFTMRLPGHGKDRSIVEAIITLADAIGMTVCAEGIETEEQAAALAGMNCPLAQGFLWGRPMPHQDFVDRLAQA